MSDCTQQKIKEYRRLKQLVDKECIGVTIDSKTAMGPYFGLVFEGGLVAWILADPECNGPGHLQIDEVK